MEKMCYEGRKMYLTHYKLQNCKIANLSFFVIIIMVSNRNNSFDDLFKIRNTQNITINSVYA